jgi:hypothetical protein
MDWGAIGAVGEIIGGGAVIFSILYLAFQIRESRIQAVALSQRELLDTSKFWIPIASVPGATRDVRQALNNYDSIDPDTQARFHHFMMPLINHVEAVRHMKTKGLVDEDTYERWMAGIISIISTDGGKVWWSKVRVMFGPGYVAEIEQMRDEAEGMYIYTDTMHFFNRQSLETSEP